MRRRTGGQHRGRGEADDDGGGGGGDDAGDDADDAGGRKKKQTWNRDDERVGHTRTRNQQGRQALRHGCSPPSRVFLATSTSTSSQAAVRHCPIEARSVRPLRASHSRGQAARIAPSPLRAGARGSCALALSNARLCGCAACGGAVGATRRAGGRIITVQSRPEG